MADVDASFETLAGKGGTTTTQLLAAIDALRAVGREFHARGWSLGTSSNYSVRLCRQPLRLLLTGSGHDKGALRRRDFVIVDENGESLGDTRGAPPEEDLPERFLASDDAPSRPSAETMLHVVACQREEVGAVLHTHSPASTLLSDWRFEERGFEIAGFEMLKGLSGVSTHEHREWIEIVENTQDIAALAARMTPRFSASAASAGHAYLIRKHGLYTWGKDLAEARRHIEILEFLFDVLLRDASRAAAMNLS